MRDILLIVAAVGFGSLFALLLRIQKKRGIAEAQFDTSNEKQDG